MNIKYIYGIVLFPLLTQCLELNLKKRCSDELVHDTEFEPAVKKSKPAERRIDFDLLKREVEIGNNKLNSLHPNGLGKIGDQEINIIEEVIAKCFGNRNIDVYVNSLLHMALYDVYVSNMTLHDLLIGQWSFRHACRRYALILEKIGFVEKYAVSAEALIDAYGVSKADVFMNMLVEKYKCSAYGMMIQNLFDLGEDEIKMAELVLSHSLKNNTAKHDLYQSLADGVSNLDGINFIINHYCDDCNVLMDEAIKALNLPMIEALTPYCQNYDYSKVFFRVCDTRNYESHDEAIEKIFPIFRYLLTFVPSDYLLACDDAGIMPLGYTEGVPLKKIIMFLIEYYEDIFIAWMQNDSFCNRARVGLGLQFINEIVEIMKQKAKKNNAMMPTFKYIDSLMRTRTGFYDIQSLCASSLQATPIIACLRHDIPLDPLLISTGSIEYVLALLNRVKYNGNFVLENDDYGEISLDNLVKKYAECKNLLRQFIVGGATCPIDVHLDDFYEDSSEDVDNETSMSPSIDEESGEDESDEVSVSSYSLWCGDTGQLNENNGRYCIEKIGINLFFTSSDLFEIIIAKIENKALDGLCDLLKIMAKEGYSFKLVKSIFFYALQNGHIWAAVILGQKISKIHKGIDSRSLIWRSIIENPNFRNFIDAAYPLSNKAV